MVAAAYYDYGTVCGTVAVAYCDYAVIRYIWPG